MNWKMQDMPSQSGRRVLVTGANAGIGFHVALELARSGAEVVLPARTLEKSLDAIQRIKSEVPNAKLVSGTLDLASLASIRAFAQFFADHFPGQSLDVLINNAGVMGVPKRELTVDGFERLFATNYLGPFALTSLLFQHLKAQPGTRVVTIAAAVVHGAKIDFDDLQSERAYKPLGATLSQSKLANLIFTIELQHRLRAVGSPIFSVGAHPGVSLTKNAQDKLTGLQRIIAPRVISMIGQSAAHAALPLLYAAISPDVKPGGYYGPDGFKEFKGQPAAAKIPAAATDKAVATRLWTETERLTGVPFDLGSGTDREEPAARGSMDRG